MEIVESFLLNKDIDLNSHRGQNMDTPLHLAVNNGNIIICTMLLKNGAKVEVLNVNNVTPLHIAIAHGNIKIVNVLLSYGADIHRKDKENKSYLHITASRGHVALSKKLVQDYNFQIDKTDNKGFNGLHSVTESGSLELFQYFVEKGTNVYSRTKSGRNCLHIAASKGYLSLCKVLLKNFKFDIRMTNDSGWNILHCASESGNLDLFQYLRAKESDIYRKTKDGKHCLHIAASKGRLHLSKTLLENYKFDIKSKDDEGLNVLHFAIKSGNLELFQYLIQNERDVCCITNVGRNYLHMAAAGGHLNFCKSLLKNHKFSIHTEDDNGCTALHCACESGDLHLIQYFMEHGSNILSENKNNMNCVHVAASNGHLKLSKILIEKYRLDFKTRTKDGWSVLHYVARIGDVKFFSISRRKRY